MRKGESRGRFFWLCACLLCFLGVVSASSQAAGVSPYEFSAELSLTGGCGTSKADEVPDPGCPEKKPPKSFTKPTSIAIDSFGDEYVASFGAEEGKQGRIDVFSPEGVFITEVPDSQGPRALAVDSEGNLYVFDSRSGSSTEVIRYEPTTYKPGEEKIDYDLTRHLVASEGSLGFEGAVSVDSSDNHLFVDARGSILEYNSAAEGNELKATITNERLNSSTFIAIDAQRRRLYASSCPDGDITKCWVIVLNADAPHELLKEVKGPDGPESEEIFRSRKGWISIAVDEKSGDFFVGDLELSKNVYQFNENYEPVSTLELSPSLFEGGEALQIALSNAEGAFNETDLFVPSLKNRALAYNPPKEEGPPIVESLSVSGIGEEEAEAQAKIRPDGAGTTYRFEYLTEEEWLQAGESFAGAKVAGEGTIPATTQEAVVKAPLEGLALGTAYRFRVFAENEFGPEGKKEVGEDEEEGTFTTYADAPITSSCPEAIRSTHSTLLPDCRAYELVTPADTNGRPPRGVGFGGDQFPTLEASSKGEDLSFLTDGGTIPGFEGTGSLNGDLYHVARTPTGWQTTSAGPTGEETISANPGSVSPDQGYSFWQATREGSAVIEGEATHYVRYPDSHSALVGRGSLGTDPRARGKLITANGVHIIFETNPVNTSEEPIQLEEEAPPTGTTAVYDRSADEVTHVVSLLPGSVTPKAGENAEYVGASPDGEGIAFQITKGENAGRLYLRVGDAETYGIGKGLTFAGVSEKGSRIFYLQGGDLRAFDVSSEEAVDFTEVANAVPVNVSADGTRAYFASTTAIGGLENPNEESPVAGKENLYLSEEGAISFVGTVTERDVAGEPFGVGKIDGLGLWAFAGNQPAIDPSRTNPDGSVLLFSSRADLDGYAHPEVPEIYRYDRAAGRLHCISCLPIQVSASGGAALQSISSASNPASPLSSTAFVQNLRADGKRAIFESTEALVSRDNDGVRDVYEWEESGVGSCTRAGGCLYLISSGGSTTDNFLYAISQNGNDVFFTTADVLANGDDKTVSIYDARVNGGFAEEPDEPCQGEGCKPGLSPAPPIANSESEARPESGNVPKPSTKPCPKHKHRVKGRCVKKHHHKKHHRKAGKAKKGASK